MIQEERLLQESFSNLLRWERVKRREEILISSLFYAVVASLLTLPAAGLLPEWFTPLYLPGIFFMILTPGFFLRRGWRERESVRAVFSLDKALRLEERALTAWEIIHREEKKAPELLVLKEAGQRLQRVDPRGLLKRRVSWHAYLVPPLFLLWLFLAWLDVGGRFEKASPRSQPTSTAQRLKEFSRDLQERAKAEGLSESLKAARALEEIAEKSLKGELSEKDLGENLSRTAERLGGARDPGKESGDVASLPEGTRQALLDFKAELQSFKENFKPSVSAAEKERLRLETLGRLGAFPRLKEAIQRGFSSMEHMAEEELRGFLDRLEKSLTAELDRRTLDEIKEFLAFLLQGSEGRERQEALARGRVEKDLPEKSEGKGELPGSKPGTKAESPQVFPPLQAAAAAQLKGLLGEGKAGAVPLTGVEGGARRKIAQEEVMVSYRKKMEEAIASEKIPDSLKEIIKNYFLSLGMREK